VSVELDVQTGNKTLIGQPLKNYDIIKRSYKKVLKKSYENHQKLDISKIYDRIIVDLHWDKDRRPTVRQNVAKYKKELSNEQKKKSKK